jgi:XTP/dITP diphosphohydrolase
MEIVVATRNRHKLKELTDMLAGMDVVLVGLDAFPGCPDVVEDGASFTENALKKAREIASYTHHVTAADDSGLEVDALNGLPGIYSARYAGVQGDDRRNNEKLLHELEGVPPEKRGARFRCVIAVAVPDGEEKVVEGTCKGVIITAPRGNQGFGYDPVFLDEESGLTFAEMDGEYKNRISHRSRAVEELKKILPPFLSSCTKKP